jgi:4-alpha-glucanotransferase
MKTGRASGILLHPTSLPGRFGIGDLGPESYRFLDFLQEAKQKVWHVLPLGPTGPQNSPYQCRSAFAGNPLLISPDKLVEEGYLDKRDLSRVPHFPGSRVEFNAVRSFKYSLFRQAFKSFTQTKAFSTFEEEHSSWLKPFAEFMALREANGGISWARFDPAIRAAADALRFHKFLQYEFFRQWNQLKARCAKCHVFIMGDMPFYIEHDSADVWHSPDLFDLDQHGESRTVGGVPPDYFSRNGQLWGNPTYRWKAMEKTNYAWWKERFRTVLQLVDLLRLDHFRGFEKFWSVPASHTTARNGKWIKGPGQKLFAAVTRSLGPLPLIAENLGIITPQVEELRQSFQFPGMAVLQFAFGEDPTHRPTHYVPELVAFTGTHDNDTTRGWWTKLNGLAKRNPEMKAQVDRVRAYLQTDGLDICWPFIQAVMTSVAKISVIPMQDFLALGTKARFNVPGKTEGNWRWRYTSDAISSASIVRLRTLTEASDR